MSVRGANSDKLEAVLRLRVVGPTGAAAEVDAVVDTGYTGALTLPAGMVSGLGLVPRSKSEVTLADGSRLWVVNYSADIEWSGAPCTARVTAMGDEALVGMKLLAGHELRVEVTPGGAVEVRPLPAPPPG